MHYRSFISLDLFNKYCTILCKIFCSICFDLFMQTRRSDKKIKDRHSIRLVVDDVREHQGRGLHVTCVTGGNRMIKND
jgi:hypothetical protein